MITEVYPNPHLIQKCDTDSSTTSSRLVKASRFYRFAHVAQTLNSRSLAVWQHMARWLKQTADRFAVQSTVRCIWLCGSSMNVVVLAEADNLLLSILQHHQPKLNWTQGSLKQQLQASWSWQLIGWTLDSLQRVTGTASQTQPETKVHTCQWETCSPVI